MKALLIFLFLIFAAISLTAQNIDLPSNPLDGRIIFEEKGCIECHAIGGYGGNVGPDLSRKHYYGGFWELASIIWNHIPDMNRKYRELKIDLPNFTKNELENLFGFIYYLRYLGEPGSVSKGKKLLESKQCLSCHTEDGTRGKIGPDFTLLEAYASPVFMVQSMWNHFPQMLDKFIEKNIKYPELNGEEITDISTYLNQVAVSATRKKMTPGNPNLGKRVFESKGCGNCHSVKQNEEGLGPNLREMDLNKSVTDIAGLMWKHSSDMVTSMNKESLNWPFFEGNEMADLIAFLYFLNFLDEKGSLEEGEKIFVNNGCIACHEPGGNGPDILHLEKITSPINMVQLMWNHSLRMEELVLSLNKKWPELTLNDFKNLYFYLRRTIPGD